MGDTPISGRRPFFYRLNTFNTFKIIVSNLFFVLSVRKILCELSINFKLRRKILDNSIIPCAEILFMSLKIISTRKFCS